MIRLDMLGTLALRGADGRELRAVLAQPKRLTLLGYLAVESSFQRRDHLFALFWPELSQTQARQALRQSLYFLRRELGEHVVANRGAEEIGIAAGTLQCDVAEFLELLDQQRLEDALALYRGDLLAGVFVADASPELEQWLDTARAQVRTRALESAWTLADAAARDCRLTDAARWARFAARLAPLDERSLQRLVCALDRQGDRTGALRAYNEFADRIRADLDLEPSAATRAMIDAVRRRADAPVAGPEVEAAPAASVASVVVAPAASVASVVVAPAPPTPAAVAPPPPTPNRPVSRFARVRRFIYIAAGGAAAALILAALAPRFERARPLLPVVAVGWIQDPSGADTGATVRTFAELLSNDLARMPDLHVVSHAKLYDMMKQLGARDETPSAISDAARRAGADELLEAVLAHRPGPGGTLHLELQPVDLATGKSGAPHLVDANTVFELADRATAQVAADFGLRTPARPVSDVTTTSLSAYRLFEDGLRRFSDEQAENAAPLFHAALDEDSTFAMAAYYAGLAEVASDGLAARRDLALAQRLAQHASDRERLTIRQTWANLTNDPSQLALAESLATRYPDEPGAELALGTAMSWHGDFLAAIPHLRRAVQLDTIGLTGSGRRCRQACDALQLMQASYISADSFPAAELAARARTRLEPASADAWWALADVFARELRPDSALADEQIAERVGGPGFGYVVPRVVIALRSGDFAAADRTLEDRVQYGNPAVRGEALWWLVISLRNQGRLGEALAAAKRLVRTTSGEPPGFNSPRSLDAAAEGQVLFEMGRYRASARLFDTMAAYPWTGSPDFPKAAPGLVARHHIWMATHVATALAAAGDTAQLPALIDSLTAWGPKSAYHRDRALHHFARGLLFVARGARADAEREYRAALVAPIDGYSRINYELGALLIAEGRAREAIPVLEAPLHGAVESSNYYLTDTDVHAKLGEAFDRAGEPDSARVHYQRALAAWRNADPQFHARIAAIEQRVRVLQVGESQPGR
ncbi:MAG TPA: BTAD domain-containing putative transcriptional regulator [Gemmatimonadaceae bacterium]|nr:BTAD domain-containing putative transcriptional regulator [Gemmatimonadaceae bacterium]